MPHGHLKIKRPRVAHADAASSCRWEGYLHLLPEVIPLPLHHDIHVLSGYVRDPSGGLAVYRGGSEDCEALTDFISVMTPEVVTTTVGEP